MKKSFKIKQTRPIIGKRFGVFQSIMKGSGSDKTDFRKYNRGDSNAHINRRISAKYQELYTTIFQQEKSLTLDLFLDINYNRRGGEVPNVQQVRGYAQDIISYCQHQHILLNIIYPKKKIFGSSTLHNTAIKKINEETFGLLDTILQGVKKTSQRYKSSLTAFLQQAITNKERRALVIFSDFLSLGDEEKKLLHYLKKTNILFLFQLPIDENQGQNYNSLLVEHKKITPATGSNEIELLQID